MKMNERMSVQRPTKVVNSSLSSQSMPDLPWSVVAAGHSHLDHQVAALLSRRGDLVAGN